MRQLSPLLVGLAVAAGCQLEPGETGPRQVSMAQLGRETDHLVFFSYVGSDTEFHHFTTAEDRRYTVARAEWDNPKPFALDGGIELFVSVRDGQLTVPDPNELAALSEDELHHRPYKRRQP